MVSRGLAQGEGFLKRIHLWSLNFKATLIDDYDAKGKFKALFVDAFDIVWVGFLLWIAVEQLHSDNALLRIIAYGLIVYLTLTWFNLFVEKIGKEWTRK